MKRPLISKQTKRSIIVSLLEGKYTVARAARLMGVQPATIKRWLIAFGQDVLCASTLHNSEMSQPQFGAPQSNETLNLEIHDSPPFGTPYFYDDISSRMRSRLRCFLFVATSISNTEMLGSSCST